MTYHGIVRNGQVFVEGGVPLPEGAAIDFDVRVIDSQGASQNTNQVTSPVEGQTLYEALKPFIGVIKDLPADFSRRHDYYVHGTPDE